MARRLSFFRRFLAPVRDGRKVTTIRKARLVRSLRPGDPITLAFGARHDPALLSACCTSLEAMGSDLSPEEMERVAERDGISVNELRGILASDEPMVVISFRLEPS